MTDLLGDAVPALLDLLRPEHLYHLCLGVLIGLCVGILPGFGGITGMALVLPFVFGMDPASALAMMIGLTSVTNTSDTFPSVLLGVPGTASAQATVMDGHPMARRGEGGRALAAAFAASMAGGIFGALFLTAAVVAARPLLLLIGFGEQLFLILLALTVVGLLSGASMLKGLAACGLGLLLGSIGTAAATAEHRMTFGTLYLDEGIHLVPVALGLFAVPEILDGLRFRERVADRLDLRAGRLAGLRDVWLCRWIVLRCSVIGAALGALPGLGGSVIDWVAYGHVLQSARDRAGFGKGDVRGVIAPESANNAKEGGALVPTLLFGIPGSGTMALLLSGLVLIGVQPGRQMIEGQLSLTFMVIWSIALANVLGAGICFALAPRIARLAAVPYPLLAPVLIVLVVFATFQTTASWPDIVALAGFGCLGSGMKHFGWSRPALLIGFVLSQNLEAAFYRTAQIYGFEVFGRPVAMAILACIIVMIATTWRARRAGAVSVERGRDHKAAFAAAMMALPLLAILDAWRPSFLTHAFPLAVAALTSGLIVPVILAARTAGSGDDAVRPAGVRFSARFVIGQVAVLLGLSAAIGYLPAIPIFILSFLRRASAVPWARAAGLAAGTTLTIWGVVEALDLPIPRGLLLETLR